MVVYSMAASSAEDAPRGMGFLFNLSRLNVAETLEINAQRQTRHARRAKEERAALVSVWRREVAFVG